jgi:purine nucleoside permease
MRFLKRGLMAHGALSLVALFLNLVAPKSVHAAVAALVQVANTAANPAITQDTSKAASQLVYLVCYPPAESAPFVVQCSSQGGSGAQYTVPSGQNLVVTSMMITPA